MHTFKYNNDFSGGEDLTIEVSTNSVTMEGVMEVFKQYLLAVGFQPTTIAEYFEEEEG